MSLVTLILGCITPQDISLAADLAILLVSFVGLITFVLWRLLNIRSSRGVQTLLISPPSISSPLITFGHRDPTAKTPDRTNVSQPILPVLILIQYSLLNADIFPEILGDASLKIKHLATGNQYELKPRFISKADLPTEKTANSMRLVAPAHFRELILKPRTDELVWLFFVPTEEQNMSLGNMATGEYRAILKLKKRKFWWVEETLVLAFVIEEAFAGFMQSATIIMKVPGEGGLSVICDKKWWQFWKRKDHGAPQYAEVGHDAPQQAEVDDGAHQYPEVKNLAIGQKLFEEKFRPLGGAIKSIGSEGLEAEFSLTGEITGFGKAQGVKGTNIGTLHILTRPDSIATGTGLGVMTLDGDTVTWKFGYAGKPSAAGETHVCTVTFMTTSAKLAWLNQTICVMEGQGEADPTKVGTNVFYEWS